MDTPEFIKENFNTLSVDYFKFIFEQSEKFLNRLVTVGENITKKAHAILIIAVSVFTLSVGCVFTMDDQKIVFCSVVLAILSVGAILLLLKPLISYTFSVQGSMPKKLLDKDFVESFSTDENIIKNLILNEIIDYQTRIDDNAVTNRNRIQYVDYSMFLLVSAPFISWIASLIFG
jgi:hypothetical protein